MRLLIGTALVVALGVAPVGQADAAPTAMEQQCFDAVQGKVAYNQQGSRSWVESNLRNLCQGTTNPTATIACFQAEIRTHNSWQRGIQACASKPTAGATPARPSSETARPPQSPPTGAPSSKPAATVVTGRTATLVEVGQSGRKLGEYRQTAAREWVETGTDGKQFRFEETNRDDWSVYLTDRSRGVDIQIDLHTRTVMYGDAGSQRRPLYDVLAATAEPPAARSAAGHGSIDPSFMLLRSGPVTGESDAVSKCTAACRHYQGFSGHWAIAVEPDLGVCQCRARPLTEVAAHEILSDVIRTGEEAARTCPSACRWYGGGDGSWGALDDHSSICGCLERVAP